ncbi:MAG TPA: hypothetical protein VFS24_11695 [Steroidobacteraceae bacterium]|nr:hypothetical protein [Steroidobacteraceae bacterium]
MKFRKWVLLDKRGRIMRYTNDQPVIYDTRKDAKLNADCFDPSREWRPVRAEVTVGGEQK